MKLLSLTAAILVLMGSVAGCGGGGDAEAGSPTALGVQPKTTTVTVIGGDTSPCASGYIGEYFVYGGAAPYRLDNTAPDLIALNKNQVNERGGSFSVNYVGGGCFAPVLIVIVDALDHQVVLELNNKKTPPTTTPTTPAALTPPI
jgi:hypothetical protein